MVTFTEMLEARQADGKFICIGLDPDLSMFPKDSYKRLAGVGKADQAYWFLREIIDATHQYALAYKPNIAFFEAMGERGLHVLRNLIRYIKKHIDPNIPVIVDAKRADIGNTNEAYAKAIFDDLGVDAVTVHPYLGMEAMRPFLNRADKGVIVLCRTSNKGAGEFQDAELQVIEVDGKYYSTRQEYMRETGELNESFAYSPCTRRLYQFVAHRVAESWNYNGNCLLVVGATYPDELAQVRNIVGDDMWILVPGIGSQGGDLSATIKAGGRKLILNNSSAILYAFSKLRDNETGEFKYTWEQFPEAAAEAAKTMHDVTVAEYTALAA